MGKNKELSELFKREGVVTMHNSPIPKVYEETDWSYVYGIKEPCGEFVLWPDLTGKNVVEDDGIQ